MGIPIKGIGKVTYCFTHRTESGSCYRNRSSNYPSSIFRKISWSTSRTTSRWSDWWWSDWWRCSITRSTSHTDSRSVTGPGIGCSSTNGGTSKSSNGCRTVDTESCSCSGYWSRLCSNGSSGSTDTRRRNYSRTSRTTTTCSPSCLRSISRITGFISRIKSSISAPRTKKDVTLFINHLSSRSIIFYT